MTVKSVPVHEIGFELREVCRECPFRMDAPDHEGMATDIFLDIKRAAETGEFAHSCHLSDPRSDYPGARLINGKVQHCVGAIISCEKSNKGQMPYLAGMIKHDLTPEDFKGWERVGTFDELRKKYAPQAIKRCRSLAKKRGLKVDQPQERSKP